MTSKDFTNKLKELGLTNVYPNNIPTGKNATGVYIYNSNANQYLTSGRINFQFLTANLDLNACESESISIIEWLLSNSNLLEFTQINDYVIYGLNIQQLSPMYIGLDNEKRYQFSFNIELTIKKVKL